MSDETREPTDAELEEWRNCDDEFADEESGLPPHSRTDEDDQYNGDWPWELYD